MLQDLDEYEKKFNLLYSSPRLEHPAWLTVMSNRRVATDRSHLFLRQPNQTDAAANVCNNLINELVCLNKIFNANQATPFNGKRFLSTLRNSLVKEKTYSAAPIDHMCKSTFLSVLMSTVLKHHLSWVYTVLPSNDYCAATAASNNSSLRKQRAHWTSILEKTNPYNPLWAQLGDLHGAVNHPLKLVRTVVVGKNKEIVERLLFLLSYFIRCGKWIKQIFILSLSQFYLYI